MPLFFPLSLIFFFFFLQLLCKSKVIAAKCTFAELREQRSAATKERTFAATNICRSNSPKVAAIAKDDPAQRYRRHLTCMRGLCRYLVSGGTKSSPD